MSNINIELTREESFFLGIILDDEKRECIKRYDGFLEQLDKPRGLTYPKDAEASFLRILGRIDTIREKLKVEKV